MAEAHLVQELHFEVEFASPEQAWEEQERLASFIQGPALRIVEEEFDRYSRDNLGHCGVSEVLRLDALELDLGEVDIDELEAQWAQRLQARLQDALAGLPTRRRAALSTAVAPRTAAAEAPTAGGEWHSREAAELDALMHFLLHGHLPWHQALHTDPQALGERVWQHSPQALLDGLARWLGQAQPQPALHRLALQFSPAWLQGLDAGLRAPGPAHPPWPAQRVALRRFKALLVDDAPRLSPDDTSELLRLWALLHRDDAAGLRQQLSALGAQARVRRRMVRLWPLNVLQQLPSLWLGVQDCLAVQAAVAQAQTQAAQRAGAAAPASQRDPWALVLRHLWADGGLGRPAVEPLLTALGALHPAAGSTLLMALLACDSAAAAVSPAQARATFRTQAATWAQQRVLAAAMTPAALARCLRWWLPANAALTLVDLSHGALPRAWQAGPAAGLAPADVPRRVQWCLQALASSPDGSLRAESLVWMWWRALALQQQRSPQELLADLYADHADADAAADADDRRRCAAWQRCLPSLPGQSARTADGIAAKRRPADDDDGDEVVAGYAGRATPDHSLALKQVAAALYGGAWAAAEAAWHGLNGQAPSALRQLLRAACADPKVLQALAEQCPPPQWREVLALFLGNAQAALLDEALGWLAAVATAPSPAALRAQTLAWLRQAPAGQPAPTALAAVAALLQRAGPGGREQSRSLSAAELRTAWARATAPSAVPPGSLSPPRPPPSQALRALLDDSLAAPTAHAVQRLVSALREGDAATCRTLAASLTTPQWREALSRFLPAAQADLLDDSLLQLSCGAASAPASEPTTGQSGVAPGRAPAMGRGVRPPAPLAPLASAMPAMSATPMRPLTPLRMQALARLSVAGQPDERQALSAVVQRVARRIGSSPSALARQVAAEAKTPALRVHFAALAEMLAAQEADAATATLQQLTAALAAGDGAALAALEPALHRHAPAAAPALRDLLRLHARDGGRRRLLAGHGCADLWSQWLALFMPAEAVALSGMAIDALAATAIDPVAAGVQQRADLLAWASRCPRALPAATLASAALAHLLQRQARRAGVSTAALARRVVGAERTAAAVRAGLAPVLESDHPALHRLRGALRAGRWAAAAAVWTAAHKQHAAALHQLLHQLYPTPAALRAAWTDMPTELAADVLWHWLPASAVGPLPSSDEPQTSAPVGGDPYAMPDPRVARAVDDKPRPAALEGELAADVPRHGLPASVVGPSPSSDDAQTSDEAGRGPGTKPDPRADRAVDEKQHPAALEAARSTSTWSELLAGPPAQILAALQDLRQQTAARRALAQTLTERDLAAALALFLPAADIAAMTPWVAELRQRLQTDIQQAHTGEQASTVLGEALMTTLLGRQADAQTLRDQLLTQTASALGLSEPLLAGQLQTVLPAARPSATHRADLPDLPALPPLQALAQLQRLGCDSRALRAWARTLPTASLPGLLALYLPPRAVSIISRLYGALCQQFDSNPQLPARTAPQAPQAATAAEAAEAPQSGRVLRTDDSAASAFTLDQVLAPVLWTPSTDPRAIAGPLLEQAAWRLRLPVPLLARRLQLQGPAADAATRGAASAEARAGEPSLDDELSALLQHWVAARWAVDLGPAAGGQRPAGTAGSGEAVARLIRHLRSAETAASDSAALQSTWLDLTRWPQHPARGRLGRELESATAAQRLAQLLEPHALLRVVVWLRPADAATLQAIWPSLQALSPSWPPVARSVLRELFEEGRSLDPNGLLQRTEATLGRAATRPGMPIHTAMPMPMPMPIPMPGLTGRLMQRPAASLLHRSEPWLFEPLPREPLFIANAGLVLAGPYLPRLFGMLGLVADQRFVDDAAAERAVLLTQYAVTGQTQAAEPLLLLNKLLCGVPLQMPIARELEASAAELQAVDGLLLAMIGHWKALGQTSLAGLRQTYLQREGRLEHGDEAWQLQVQPTTFDVLLDRLPWGYATLKFPWMPEVLHVDWR